MKSLHRLFVLVASAAFFIICTPVFAQWQVSNGAIPLGKGSGTGFGYVSGSGGSGAKCLLDTTPPTFGNCTGAITGGTLNYALMGNGASAASFKGFLQTGTGAVTRTWQSKAQEPISVKDFGVVCDGSTDNASAFQAAINALPSAGGTLLIPGGNGNCVIASGLDFTAKRNVTVRGDASFATVGTASHIVYSGAGTRVFDVRDTSGIVFEKLSVVVTNNSFSGIIFDAGTAAASVSFYFKLSEVSIIGNGTNTPTCVNVSNAIESVIDRVSFVSCDIGVRGQQTLGQSTVVKIFSSQFFTTKTMPISDCGESWSIIGNTFEQLASSNNAGAISINSARPCKNIAIIGNWFGDANTTGTWISLAANGAVIQGNRIANGAVGIAMVGGSGYNISGNAMESTTAFSCSSAPTGGAFGRNYFTGVTTILGGGCVDFDYGGLRTTSPQTKTADYTQLITDGPLIFNKGSSATLTLLAASSFCGLEIRVRTIQAQTVVSASPNVVPLAGGAAGTAILAATAGKWADLKSDCTNWQIMASN